MLVLYIANYWLLQDNGVDVLCDITLYIPAEDMKEAVDKAMETTDERIHLNSIKIAEPTDQFKIRFEDV